MPLCWLPDPQHVPVIRRSRSGGRQSDQELVVVLERYFRVVGNRKLAPEQPAAPKPDAEGEDDAEQEQVERGEPASGAREWVGSSFHISTNVMMANRA